MMGKAQLYVQRSTSGPGGTGWSLIVHDQGVTSTPGVDTTGAHLIVVALHATNSASMSDSKGNPWTPLTDHSYYGFFGACRLFYCVNPTAGAGHTFTGAGGSADVVSMVAFSGANASPFDGENGTSNTVVDSLATGAVTPSVDDCLIVAAITISGDFSGIPDIDSGFTTVDGHAGAGGVAYGAGIAFLIQGTAGMVDPIWSWSDLLTPNTGYLQNASTAIAVFKPL